MSAISLDPLIAEAKRRAQRRRLYLLAVLAVAAAAALTYALLPSAHPGRPGRERGASATRLRGVDTVGSSGGVTWVMNGRGLWLAANGENAWRKVAVPQGTGSIEQQGSSVDFVDPQHGWISINELTGHAPHLGERSMFARTTDGGRTWQPSFPSGCNGRCGAAGMSFLDARHGYLLAGAPGAGVPTTLFRTTDGGRTWQPVAEAPVIGPITFLDDRVGFAFANSGCCMGPYFGPPIGRLYRTTDGGRTWSPCFIHGSKSLVEEPIAVAGHRIVIVQNGPSRDGGMNTAPGTIYVSADGRHWSGSAVPGQPAVASSFTAASPRVWAFSNGRGTYATRDAGRHWRKIGAPPQRATRLPLFDEKVDFTSSRVGWAVLDRRLYRTTDGGVHWTAAGPRRRERVLQACKPSQLTIRVWSSSSRLRRGSAVVQFLNEGRLGCRLSGWPTVVGVAADGRTIRAERISLHLQPDRWVVLGPGGAASATLHGIDVRPAGAPASCPRAVALKVTPPGAIRATTVAGPWARESGRTFSFALCSGISITPLFR